jgi:hypothetical protein
MRMAEEKWIYQVKMDTSGTRWDKVGEDGDPPSKVVTEAVYHSPILEDYKKRTVFTGERITLDPQVERLQQIGENILRVSDWKMYEPYTVDPGSEEMGKVAEEQHELMVKRFGETKEEARRTREGIDYVADAEKEQNARKIIFQNIFNELFRKGYLRWAVENPEASIGSERDIRLNTSKNNSIETDWQIFHNGRWVNAYLTGSYIDERGEKIPSIVDFLADERGLRIDPFKMDSDPSYMERVLLKVMGSPHPHATRSKSPILRRRIPAEPGGVGTITDKDELKVLVESLKPYHELLDQVVGSLQHKTYIKLLGAIWGVNDYGHLHVSVQGGKINYAGDTYPISVFSEWLKTSGSNSFFVGNTRFTPSSSTRPFSFMSVGELEQLKIDLTELFDVDSAFLRNLPLEERLGLGWRKLIYQKVLEAIDAELGRKTTEQDKFPADLGWALWRDVAFADKAWKGYKNLVNERTSFLAAGLSDAELEAILNYYLDLVPRDKFSSIVLANDSLLRLGRFVELPPHEGGDMPGRERWGYDYRKDVLEKYIGAILNTNQLPLESPITPELGPSGEYRGFPSIYDQQHPLQSYVPPIGEQQAVASITSVGGGVWGPAALLNLAMYGALPEQGTQTELTSTTPAGGDGVVASSVGQAPSLSMPSFPSVMSVEFPELHRSACLV